MEKRGQLTTFVLVSFVILVLIIVLTVIFISTSKVSISDKTYTNKKINEAKEAITDCITNAIAEGIKTVGLRGLADYMKDVRCDDGLSEIADIRVNGEPKISSVVSDDKIDVVVDYDLTAGKGSNAMKLGVQSYTFELLNGLNVDDDSNGKADDDMKIELLNGVAMLQVPAGTGVSNQNINLKVIPASNDNQLSDTIAVEPSNVFGPYAILSIAVFACEEDDEMYALVDKKTGVASEAVCITVDNGKSYVVGEIVKASEYFYGSCMDFSCGWVPADDTGDEENECEDKEDDTPCSGGVCLDGVCETEDNLTPKLGDVCGDSECTGGENSQNCPNDCGGLNY